MQKVLKAALEDEGRLTSEDIARVIQESRTGSGDV